MLTTVVHIENLVTLTSFIIATTVQPVLIVKTSVANFIIKKDRPKTLTKIFTSHLIRLQN